MSVHGVSVRTCCKRQCLYYVPRHQIVLLQTRANVIFLQFGQDLEKSRSIWNYQKHLDPAAKFSDFPCKCASIHW